MCLNADENDLVKRKRSTDLFQRSERKQRKREWVGSRISRESKVWEGKVNCHL